MWFACKSSTHGRKTIKKDSSNFLYGRHKFPQSSEVTVTAYAKHESVYILCTSNTCYKISMFQLFDSKSLFLLNCICFSNEDNHRNLLKSTSRKEHKAEKIIQKLQPLLFNNVSTYNLKAVGNKWTNGNLHKTSSIKTSLPLHRKGLLTLLNNNKKNQTDLKMNCLLSAKWSLSYECILKLRRHLYITSNYRAQYLPFNCYNPACTALLDILFCNVFSYETLDVFSLTVRL